MIRRNFLTLLGAAIAAPALPALPAAARAAAVPAAVPRAFPYGLANFYTRHNSTVSAGKLARYLNVSPGQAEQLIARLVQDQRLITSGVPGVYRATTPAPHPKSAEIKRAVKSRAEARRIEARTPQPDPDMLVYLRDMAERYFAQQATL